jgi:hypothetical protein
MFIVADTTSSMLSCLTQEEEVKTQTQAYFPSAE